MQQDRHPLVLKIVGASESMLIVGASDGAADDAVDGAVDCAADGATDGNVGFGAVLECQDGRSLESKISLEILGNLTDQSLET